MKTAAEKTRRVLRAALKKLGPHGEKWGTPQQGKQCAWTAIFDVLYPGKSEAPDGACDKWARILGFKDADGLFAWNDHPKRMFSEVRALFEKVAQ